VILIGSGINQIADEYSAIVRTVTVQSVFHRYMYVLIPWMPWCQDNPKTRRARHPGNFQIHLNNSLYLDETKVWIKDSTTFFGKVILVN